MFFWRKKTFGGNIRNNKNKVKIWKNDIDVEFQTIPKWDPKTGKVVVEDGLPKWSKKSKIRQIMFCWGWSSISSRRSPQYDGKIEEKELMPRVEPAADVRSGVLQFCRSCRSCSRAKEADWLENIQLLSERQHIFQTLNIPFVVDASPDQATRIFALVERAHWKKLQVQKKDILY